MCRLAALLLSLVLLPLGATEPVFRIKVAMTGRSGDTSFSSTLEIGYAPCAIWVGGSGGWTGSPAQYLSDAGGLGAIRPGMSLPFFAATHNGSASGSDGSAATVVTTGPGFALWKEWDTHGTSVHQTDPSESPSHGQAARFYRTATGARIADFGLGLVSAGRGGYIGGANPYAMEIDGQLVVKFCSFEITNEELANWKRLNKTKSATFSDSNGSVRVTAMLYVELEDPSEVDVEVEGYEQWIPEGNWQDPASPGNRLRIKARVKATGGGTTPTKARISFKLESSKERGVCLNWPMQGASQDEDLQFRKKDNPNLDPSISPTEAKTRDLVDRAEAVIACFDYGAHGTLKVTAVDKDGRPLKVTFHGQEKAALAIPKSEEGGHIADAWKAAKGATGLTDNWDEAEVPLQDAKGDGVQLYGKYRGFVVLEGGARKYLRLPPREKAHFVADPAGVFDSQRWFATSGIRAYRLDEGLYYVGSRFVDFNGPCTKYAVRLEIDDNPAGPAEQYAMTDEAGSPKVANTVKVFRGRMNAMLGRVITRVQKAVSSPESKEGAKEAALLQNRCGINLHEAAAALKRVDQGQLLERLIHLAAIHEMGHACGIIDGHTKAIVTGGQVEYEETEEQVGDVLCPMQYLNQVGRRRFVLLGLLGGSGAFCKDGFNCFRQLTVK